MACAHTGNQILMILCLRYLSTERNRVESAAKKPNHFAYAISITTKASASKETFIINFCSIASLGISHECSLSFFRYAVRRGSVSVPLSCSRALITGGDGPSERGSRLQTCSSPAYSSFRVLVYERECMLERPLRSPAAVEKTSSHISPIVLLCRVSFPPSDSVTQGTMSSSIRSQNLLI